MLEFRLYKKKILITGALGLIGSALVKKLIKNKNQLILIDYNKKNKNDFFYSNKFSHKIYNLDISDDAKVKKFFKNKKVELNNLTTVVNLAAIDEKIKPGKYFNKHFHNFSDSKIKKSISINLMGTINICKAACNHFIKKKIHGNIINIGSIYSLISPNFNLYNFSKNKDTFNKPINYVISKSSIPNFTRYIATTYAKKNIRCNCLIPHAIIDNPSRKFLLNFKKISPIGRICKVEEIINPLIFLASDASSYMTGSNLVVDGGWSAW